MSLAKSLSAPVRAYFNPRFDAIIARLDGLTRRVDLLTGEAGVDDAERQLAAQRLIDVRGLNETYGPAPFGSFSSQATNSAHFDDPSFAQWFPLVWSGATMRFHRKAWEYAFILERARQGGVLRPDSRAIGFGVGSEPIPAVLAREGMSVLATDQAPETAGHWSELGEHAVGLASLSRPEVVDDDTLAGRVSFRPVDMNAVPSDLGTFDLVWSACAIEHLGSPERGLDFVLQSLDWLEPGGVSVHTTELELTVRTETAEYGHCAVYRPDDFVALERELLARGFEVEVNLNIAMAAPEDRYVAMPPYPGTDPSHLKLAIFDSVSTSFGLAIRRPAEPV